MRALRICAFFSAIASAALVGFGDAEPTRFGYVSWALSTAAWAFLAGDD
jgi:hypothetical protein